MLKLKLLFSTVLLSWLALIGSSVYATGVFFPGDEWITIGLVVLMVLSVWCLSELLSVWFLVLSTVLLILILLLGVSYVPVAERLFYVLLTISLGLLTLSLSRIFFLLRIGNETDIAQVMFDKLAHLEKRRILLIRWAHFEQIRETNPKECRNIVASIKQTLREIEGIGAVFILDKGSFLVFVEEGKGQSCPFLDEIKVKLEEIPFNNFSQQQVIQFQMAEASLSSQDEQQPDFADLIKRLGRKLETEIIIEY